MSRSERWSWADVRAGRLAGHSLLERAPRDRMIEVIRGVCGIHAQVMPAAELSVGVRVGVTRSDVRGALWTERTLVKAYGIRGTIHLFPADELSLWVAALGTRTRPQEDKRLAALGLDRGKVAAIVRAIGEALDGRRLTFRALGDEVASRAGSWAMPSSR